MTDTIAEVALAFAKECMGWEDAREDGIGLYVYEARDPRIIPPVILHYGDLNSVLAAVRKAAGAGTVRLESQTLEPLWSAEVWMETPAGCFRKGQSRQNDPAHALMEACVAASRKMKGAV